MDTRLITFLSDFGRDDVFVGLCHAVMAAIVPEVPIVDLTHAVPPHDVVAGALALEDCVGYTGPAVHLAVVDPGVGSERAGVVIAAGEALLVGPDNGLLLPAARRLGGVRAAYRLPAPITAARTFHGRDVFAPAAARLAGGADPARLGTPLTVSRLVDVTLPAARTGEGEVVTDVRGIDRFGNVQLAATAADLRAAGLDDLPELVLHAADAAPRALRRAATFAGLGAGAAGLIEDSFGWLAIVVDRAMAARELGLSPWATVRLAAPQAGGPGVGS